jgi:hypothetical protein
MVGETGILAAAQDFFREIAPGLASVEPPLPGLLLGRDIARRRRGEPGLGIAVNPSSLGKFAEKIHEETFPGGTVPS